MGRVKVFIINGLPKSGKRTLLNKIGEYRPNTLYFHIEEDLIQVLKRLGMVNCDNPLLKKDAIFKQRIKRLWSKYNNNWFITMTNFIFEIVQECRGYTTNTIIFIEANELTDISNLYTLLTSARVTTKRILVLRDGVTCNDVLDHYNLDVENYDITITNNGGLKSFYKKIEVFYETFILKERYTNDTVIY
jgi:hypothetical protein